MSSPPPPHLLSLLHSELLPSEHILWSAQPLEREYARYLDRSVKSGRSLIIFSLLWILFAAAIILYANIAGWPSDDGKPTQPPPLAAQLLFPLFGLPFLAIGLFLATRRKRAARAARHTAYALTNQRILVIEGNPRGTSHTIFRFTAEDLARATRDDRADGVGDIIFKLEATNESVNKTPIMRPRGLLAIERVAEVDQMLRATLFKP